MSIAGDCLLTRAEAEEGFPLVPFVRHFAEVKAPMKTPWDGLLTKPICARMHRIVMESIGLNHEEHPLDSIRKAGVETRIARADRAAGAGVRWRGHPAPGWALE
jgi:hypothetical protein